ncbi:hypothetical protein HBH69_209610 [Parastagonospora nodorum]|nr:hypothetical protein HBH69_209610 [Parastagonospora nodorum]
MLFGCSIVVVVFVSLEQCSTVPRYPYLLLQVSGAGYWRVCRLGVISPASLGYIMLLRSCVGSKGLISQEQYSTVLYGPPLPL